MTCVLYFYQGPKSYWAGRCTFQSATKRPNLRKTEEMELFLKCSLKKFLNIYQKSHGFSIEAIKKNRPEMIWDRPGEYYGFLEIARGHFITADSVPPTETQPTYLRDNSSLGQITASLLRARTTRRCWLSLWAQFLDRLWIIEIKKKNKKNEMPFSSNQLEATPSR